MKCMRIFQVILLFSLCLSPAARALEITAVGGANYASPTARQNQNTIDWTGNASLTYGVFVAADLFTPRLQLETGVLSLGSEMQGYPASVNTTDDFRETQIPVLLRFNFDPWLSLGVGGYVAFGQGNVSTAANGGTIKQSFDSAGFTSNDAGLTVSLKAKLHFNNDLSLVIDTRYEHGLKNRALTAGDDFSTRSIQVLAGLGYEF
jgi:hypothetical protein